MLKRYSIEGFKSFMAPAVVEMTPTPQYDTLVDTNIHNGILKGGLFIGGNASGKSNIIHAIKFLLELLFKDSDISFDWYICNFSFNTPMKLSFTFNINGNELTYNITYQYLGKILEEFLWVNDILLLKRIASNALEAITNDETGKLPPREWNNICPQKLFLREIYFNTGFRNHPVLQKWFAFLRNSVYTDLYYKSIEFFGNINLNATEYLSANGPDKINSFLQTYNFHQQIEYNPLDSSITFVRPELQTKLPYAYESLGIKNLVSLLPKLFYVVENSGILILDEFSSGFHNELEELLLTYFMQHSKNSQVFFVSHSTNLLSNRLLRPDQIFITEFFPTSGSTLTRASDYNPRIAQNMEKMYLGGVFNGLPRHTPLLETK